MTVLGAVVAAAAVDGVCEGGDGGEEGEEEDDGGLRMLFDSSGNIPNVLSGCWGTRGLMYIAPASGRTAEQRSVVLTTNEAEGVACIARACNGWVIDLVCLSEGGRQSQMMSGPKGQREVLKQN